jgi:hypothetical protein
MYGMKFPDAAKKMMVLTKISVCVLEDRLSETRDRLVKINSTLFQHLLPLRQGAEQKPNSWSPPPSDPLETPPPTPHLHVSISFTRLTVFWIHNSHHHKFPPTKKDVLWTRRTIRTRSCWSSCRTVFRKYPNSALLSSTGRSCRLGGVVVSVLATGPIRSRVRTRPRRWIFKGDKNPQHIFLRMGSKARGRKWEFSPSVPAGLQEKFNMP